jgi:hypothetical protein
MAQPRQNVSLAAEALLCLLADAADVQELHGRLAFVSAVRAPGQPHASHPALAERLDQRVRAQRLARERRAWRESALEEALLPDPVVFGEQHLQLVRHRRGAGAQALQPGQPRRIRDIEDLVEVGTQYGPAIRCETLDHERTP